MTEEIVGITDAMDMNLGKLREMMRDRDAWRTPLQYSCLENPMDGGAW